MTPQVADALFQCKGRDSEHCFRCGENFFTAKPSAKSLRQFKQMTGYPFPHPHVSLNIAADAKSVGVKMPQAKRGSFCGDCAVAYMTEFNRILKSAQAN